MNSLTLLVQIFWRGKFRDLTLAEVEPRDGCVIPRILCPAPSHELPDPPANGDGTGRVIVITSRRIFDGRAYPFRVTVRHLTGCVVPLVSRPAIRHKLPDPPKFGTVLDLKTIISQNCAAVPRRARI